ncbi:hypothetical protein [Pseudomonas laurylsulfativorans]|uniref:hypothetical protein n=1 Tax=Pseudomonas laurylsulfativorans TaxID=1943631 RepID=UPI0010571C69|nr:hypothetical protein [Pseudomonas laurylsulfativorans]
MATPAIHASDTTVGPSGTNAALTVFLSEASAMTITVRRSFAAKNAKDGIGSIIQSGVLTFNPGITELAIPALVTNDNAPPPSDHSPPVLAAGNHYGRKKPPR